MTTNHPAHDPVSLDRLHQIREILSKAVAQSDGGNLGYAMADAVKVIDEVLNAEPVLYAAEETLAYAKMGELHLKCLSQPMGDAVIPLYVHRQATDEIGSWNNHMNTPTTQAGNSPVAPDGWIPVSERMPDKLIPVMVMYADGEMWSAMWSGQFWDDGCTIPDPHAITHWREMPAAPQQK